MARPFQLEKATSGVEGQSPKKMHDTNIALAASYGSEAPPSAILRVTSTLPIGDTFPAVLGPFQPFSDNLWLWSWPGLWLLCCEYT